MQFEFWHEGFIFIGIFLVIVGFPCFFTALLGTRLIDALGHFPSRSARLQMGICLQLLAVETVSFLMLALVFHIFSD